MKAVWHNQVLAEADKADLIRIEGNWHFPSTALAQGFFQPSQTHTLCPWKGEASYYHVVVGGEMNSDAAWFYPAPKQGSVERVGKDFAHYVAFWHGVEVIE